jgi:phage-related holin
MNELWSLMLSWVKVFANWYWGGGDGLLASLAVFVVMAHVTDGMCAIVDHRPLNRAWAPAMFKSILIFILVGVGNVLDINVLANTPALRTTIIFYYLSVEGIIILENAAYIGLPVPEKLREMLEQLRQDRIDGK